MIIILLTYYISNTVFTLYNPWFEGYANAVSLVNFYAMLNITKYKSNSYKENNDSLKMPDMVELQ